MTTVQLVIDGQAVSAWEGQTRLDVARARGIDVPHLCHLKPGADVALLNSLMHVIVTEGLVNEAFIEARTTGYEVLAENVRRFSPEAMAAAAAWSVAPERLSPTPGLTVVEVMRAIKTGDDRGMLVMGENPAMSDPDATHARESLAALQMLVVRDIFLTETAALADVVLPASAFAEKTGSFTNTDRTVQPGRRVLPLPRQALQDLWVLTALAQQLGLDWSSYGATPTDCDAAAARVFDEMRQLMPSHAGITWARLQRDGAVTYPCMHEGDAGEVVVFTDHFPTADGRARFVPTFCRPTSSPMPTIRWC